MFKHYLKIAFRTMWKYKTQSFTGIFGLAFALACFVPALYWLHYETSYDSFYPGADHIYRIYTVEKKSGKVNKVASKTVEVKVREQFPAIEASTVYMTGDENCRTQKMPHIRMNLLYADSTFFSVFPQTIICGDTKQPLQVMNNMILTESMAVRLFGDSEKAIGQQVQTKMRASLPPYMVTAVVKDPPAHSNFSFDAIIVHEMLNFFSKMPEEVQWKQFFVEVHVKFNPSADTNEIANQLRDLTARLGSNPDIELRMMPISEVRHQLNSDAPFTLNFIRLFVSSGILLLFTAIFNFLNLHIDLFRQRIRELRLRTVHGATQGQLIRQMLFELACAIFLALLSACCFVFIARSAFVRLLDIQMDVLQVFLLLVISGTGILVLNLFIGFLLFWRLSYLATLSQVQRKTTGQSALRRMAVTLQLVVSVLFIVAAFVVMMQMRFVNRKDLGFDRKGMIQLAGFTDYAGNVEAALIQKLMTIPQIQNLTDAYFTPQHNDDPFTTITKVEWEGKPVHENSPFSRIFTDSRFAETFKLKMVAGQWWEEGQMTKMIINQEAARIMGLREPVGSVVHVQSSEDDSVMDEYEVAGVVSDFHTLSLRNRIHPTFFIPSPRLTNTLYLRVAPGQEQEIIQKISGVLPDIDASLIEVRLTPVGELYDRLNQSEQVGLKMFSVLAIVCLLISLFGIYAVAASATTRRRKEIAIRKVVGAEVSTIVGMFFREYTLQVIIAGALALPLAYLTMSNWLQGYAYRTNIPWWLLTGIMAGVIAVVLLTVLGQVLKAANSNPAEVLKSE